MLSALASSCSTSMSVSDKKPVVVAHRGGASMGMENSLSCIERGIESGADMIEIDVHLTADSQVVVCHDPTVNRTTDCKGRIEEMTLEELRRCRLLDADGNASNETLPTLEEVLQAVKGRCPLLLEIKKKRSQYVGIERRVADLIVKYEMLDEVTVQSFNEPVLEEMHRLLPAIRLERLSFISPLHPEEYTFISSFNICHFFVTKRAVERIHKAGKEIKIWTVDSEGGAADFPVDGIITNDPKLFIR